MLSCQVLPGYLQDPVPTVNTTSLVGVGLSLAPPTLKYMNYYLPDVKYVVMEKQLEAFLACMHVTPACVCVKVLIA